MKLESGPGPLTLAVKDLFHEIWAAKSSLGPKRVFGEVCKKYVRLLEEAKFLWLSMFVNVSSNP